MPAERLRTFACAALTASLAACAGGATQEAALTVLASEAAALDATVHDGTWRPRAAAG